MMIYVKYDTDIEIMTKGCGGEGWNIVTFTVHVFCTYRYKTRYKWCTCNDDIKQQVLGQKAHLQYPTNV